MATKVSINIQNEATCIVQEAFKETGVKDRFMFLPNTLLPKNDAEQEALQLEVAELLAEEDLVKV